jgi:Tol biopolymer transport system component
LNEVRPSFATEGSLHEVRLSPDGTQVAFVVRDAPEAGIYAGPVGSDVFTKLVGYGSFATTEIAWSGDGQYIAFHVTGEAIGYQDQVGLVASGDRGEIIRYDGQGFAWAHKGAVLYVLDGARMALMRYDVAKGTAREMGEFAHHYDERFRPRVVPSADGSKIAFTSRNALEDTTRVFIVAREGGDVVSRPLTWIPGADVHVHPFWSPKGVSLGLYMVHEALETTGLVLVKKLQGDGEIYYQREGLDDPTPPAWAPDGKSILFRTDEALSRLDLADKSVHRLALNEEAPGGLRFVAPDQLALEGGDAVRMMRV